MDRLRIEASKSTPAIDFDHEHHSLSIRGESYPENSSKFYAPVFAWLENYLELPHAANITVSIEMSYFNSSSSKVFMNFFEILDQASENGKNIVVNWFYREDDEGSLECGEEFKEDVSSVVFNLIPT